MTQQPEHGKATPPAEAVKQFCALYWSGVLATVSRTVKGFPFGSVVPYDIDEQGRITICISLIAEHYRNLREDPRASLCVPEVYGMGDIQANARATLIGEFAEVDDEAVRDSYWRRFPHAPERSLAHDFVFWRCTPIKIRWIGGFGEIRWISGDDFREAPYDVISYAGRGIIDHMNADHRDALVDLLRGLAGVSVKEEQCRMTGIDARGFQVSYRGEAGISRVRLEFSSPVSTPGKVRDAVIELLQKARDHSGDLDA